MRGYRPPHVYTSRAHQDCRPAPPSPDHEHNEGLAHAINAIGNAAAVANPPAIPPFAPDHCTHNRNTMASYAAINSVPSEHAPSRPHSAEPSRRRSHRKENGIAGSASWISSVINLVNTIVGAGVLAMPHAMSNMGMVLGVLVICWSGLASGFGLYLQTRCARYLDRGSASFFALSQITYPNAAVIFDTAIAIKCFGVGISYLIIIGDLMPGVVQGFGHPGNATYLVDRHFWVTAFM